MTARDLFLTPALVGFRVFAVLRRKSHLPTYLSAYLPICLPIYLLKPRPSVLAQLDPCNRYVFHNGTGRSLLGCSAAGLTDVTDVHNDVTRSLPLLDRWLLLSLTRTFTRRAEYLCVRSLLWWFDVKCDSSSHHVHVALRTQREYRCKNYNTILMHGK